MPGTNHADGANGTAREAIEISFARFEGRISAEITNIAHDVKGVLASLAAYATTRDLEGATDRIEKLEKNQTWLIRTIIGAVVLAMLTAAGAVIAKGAHS